MNLSTTAGLSLDIPLEHAAGAVRQDYKALNDRLKQLKSDYPETQAITVSAEDMIPYGDLVQVIDTCVGQGLVSVSVTGV
jgi:biopolymer transport protein ExbD